MKKGDFDRWNPHISVFEGVYPPSEDSELLASAIKNHKKVRYALDVGTGSGYVALFLSKISEIVISSDISLYCVKCSKKNASDNGIDNISFLISDLTSAFRNNVFDIITFNPPYLPVDNNVKPHENPELAWDGGKDGRTVIARFLADAYRVLADDGEIFLVISSLTGYNEVIDLCKHYGYSHVLVDYKRFFFEILFLLKLEKI